MSICQVRGQYDRSMQALDVLIFGWVSYYLKTLASFIHTCIFEVARGSVLGLMVKLYRRT